METLPEVLVVARKDYSTKCILKGWWKVRIMHSYIMGYVSLPYFLHIASMSNIRIKKKE